MGENTEINYNYLLLGSNKVKILGAERPIFSSEAEPGN